MIKPRRYVSSVFNQFAIEVKRLKTFDEENQSKFADGSLRKKQLYMLCESLFFNGFREYENFIRDVFLLYSQGKPRTNGKSVNSFLKPKNFHHPERMIQSSMNFLDWNSPESIIERSELYLNNGYPVKTPYTLNKAALNQYKKLRNQIAHNSSSSIAGYQKILRLHFGTVPLTTPSVGEYLCLTSKKDNTKYHLLEFFELIEQMANQIK